MELHKNRGLGITIAGLVNTDTEGEGGREGERDRQTEGRKEGGRERERERWGGVKLEVQFTLGLELVLSLHVLEAACKNLVFLPPRCIKAGGSQHLWVPMCQVCVHTSAAGYPVPR